MKYLLVLGLLGFVSQCYAAPLSIARSSWSEGGETGNLLIASGAVKVSNIIFTGVTSSTLTLYDAQRFTANVTTAVRFMYVPVVGLSPSQTVAPIPVDIKFSSGLMYNVIGVNPFLIKWDYIGGPSWYDQRQ